MNKPHQATGAPLIAGLSDIAERYDVVLSDIWGVVHNGRESFAAATHALAEFRRRGGTVVLITNAPRPSGPILAQLGQLKVPREAYDGIVTSGDVTIGLIVARGSAPVYHIGPPRDLSLFEAAAKSSGAPPPPLAPLEQADYVLCTGLFDDEREVPGDYDATLAAMLERRLTLICANPDLVVQRGDDMIYCAGALAQRYEEMGGPAIYAGKPHPPIYAQALSLAGDVRGRPVDPARVLAIGDAMRTDVAGAVAQGVDVLFVTAGIHGEELHGDAPMVAAALEQFSARHGLWPTAAIRDLVW
ncbi:TIGR01459 family HAD-type hydrolase [Methylocapsa sp. S129]|uniref:TIGR01459 family HAD-type hydrolase n=1 Tax=Methylocapsa sp. S129 TaxID=1641869 RepID=UPI00131A88F0|nr:TIGR01459 family HAD-type hydrolase [Methylocapsa sp. S129]